ncbi:MAG TPA: hypothetical protein VNA65_02805 [Candidatus Dormibacteraeota bacterium]|nr:hypothetical protein [Candidatus Dormibacteraeota bacterium]
MAAGGSAATTKPLTPANRALPLTPAEVATIESLEDLCGWLGTFRERMRIASTQDRKVVEVMVQHLESRFRQRRAELA